MCGICGILRAPGDARPADRDTVAAMTPLLAHRGPDDAGIWSRRGMTLGFRRLSIIDPKGGHQPMTDRPGERAVVFNGEIYNYIELRQELVRSGFDPRTFSDTEVLLECVIRHGRQALTDLNGMFAFAYADATTGEALLARDHFGIKPLYYTEHDGALVFASELKAFLALPGFRAEPSWGGIEEYLTFQHKLDKRSMLEGVWSLPPGCVLRWKGGKASSPEPYWKPDYTIDEDHTPSYFHQRLRFLLEDAARLQLRSDAPLGAALSGGLDSSTVACLAAQHAGAGLDVFHGRFAEGPAYDESGHAGVIVGEIGAEAHHVVPSEREFVEWLPEMIYALDEPCAGPGLFPQYAVARHASEHVRVILSGHGGDELFGGYARYLVAYLEQALKGSIFQTNEEGKHIVTLSSILPNLPMLQEYTPLMRHFFGEGLFDPMDLRYFRIVDRSADRDRLLTADAAARYDGERVLESFRAVFNDADTKSYINKMLHFDTRTLLPALLQVEDRVTMACGLESRVPLLDRRIVDLVSGVPAGVKFQGGRTKHLLKEAVRGLVPDRVIDRRDKMGLPVPLNDWLRAGGAFRSFARDVLLSKDSRERGLFRPEEMERLLANEGQFSRRLWGALCLELWHQIYIDRSLTPNTLPGARRARPLEHAGGNGVAAIDAG